MTIEVLVASILWEKEETIYPTTLEGWRFFLRIAKIDEYATQFDQYNMKFAKEIKGFYPNHFFHDHMVTVGLSNTLIDNSIFGEE